MVTLSSQAKVVALSAAQASQPLNHCLLPSFLCHVGEEWVIGLAQNAMIMFSHVTVRAENVAHQSRSLRFVTEKFFLNRLTAVRCDQVIGVVRNAKMCSFQGTRIVVNVGNLDRSGLEVQ